MRILQVCPRVPWPPLDGGRVAMLQLTQSLARAGAQVDVASLNQAKFPVDIKAAAQALAPARLDTVPIDTSSYFGAAMRGYLLRVPMLVSRFYSKRFARLLRDRLRATRYDIIQLEGQFLLPYVPAIRKETRAPVVLRAQNIEFRIWEGLAEQASGMQSQGLLHVARMLGAWESAHLNDCDALVPIAEKDEHDFRELGANRPTLVLPCGIKVRATAPASGIDRHRVFFIGSMRYRPNQEAVRWLANAAWPQVLELEPRASLTIAGSGFPTDLREHLVQRGIDVAADVPDVRAFSAPFRAMLAPLFSGSGMRIKVLEAMAFGKPVIATSLGAGGIEVTAGENILLADDPLEFAQQIVQCMNDDALANRIGNAARTLVVERYDADVLARQLLDFYGELLRRAS